MAGQGPGAIAKGGLVVGRTLNYPFQIPLKVADASHLTGIEATKAFGGINASIGTAYEKLEPRGPAKWLSGLFVQFDQAAKRSIEIGDRNYNVFYGPAGKAISDLGVALGNPFAYGYAKSAGFPEPSDPKLLRRLLIREKGDPFFPMPAPAADPGGGGNGGGDAAAAAAAAAAAQTGAPPVDAAQAAAALQAAVAQAAAQGQAQPQPQG